MSADKRAPLGPPPFDFTVISDSAFELLSFLVVLMDFPEAERLRPPDDGADAGLEGAQPGRYRRCWQFKQYTGEVNWSQCERSLDRATEAYNMRRYTFIFARDLTAPQKKKFRGRLQKRHAGVKVDHIGSSRLIGKLLSSDQGERIARHFYDDPAANSRALMAAFKAGGGLETGADVAARLEGIGDFLTSHDPFFEYPASIRETGGTPPAPWPNSVLTVENVGPRSTQRTDVIPRNPEAMERYAPSFQLLFMDSEEGRRAKEAFEQTLRQGGEFEVGAGTQFEFTQMPPLFQEHVGAPLERARLIVGKRPPIPVRIAVEAPDGTTDLDLELQAIPAPSGWAGAFSAAAAGFDLEMRFRKLATRGEQNLSWRYRVASIPARERLDGVRLAIALHGGGILRMERRDTGDRLLAEPFDQRALPHWLEGLKNVLEDIVAIEEWADVQFTIPESISSGELRKIAEIAYMVKSRSSRMNFQSIDLSVPEEKLPEMQAPHMPMRLSLATETNLFGLEFALGYLEGAVETRVGSTRRLPSGEIDLRLEPATEADRAPIFQLSRERTT